MDAKIVMIAPCGINCSLCLVYLRRKNRCEGCRATNKKHHETCRIKNCEKLRQTDSGFCYECPGYPCARLKQLEKRYRARYNVFIFGNFKTIEESGAVEFLRQQEEKYLCPECGGTICMHRNFCLDCEEKRKKEAKNNRGLRLPT
jgi:hypothetical protein